ncbi:MAG: DUF488 domain-containing protein [Deltaproteobacteria bacterium]|nr:DUF488 domain-containing protein [Deltaproteobacteria bacterium]
MTAARARPLEKTATTLPARQRQLLQLLDALGGQASKLDFQKLLFLYCQESPSEAPYDFVPHKFGAFSFMSYADRRKLVERGLLVNDESTWQLTDEGRGVIGRTIDMQMAAFARRYQKLRGDELVADTYRRFPYFATRSEIAARVLKGDAIALKQIAALRVDQKRASVQTIGYEGHSLDTYLNLLLKNGTTILCDVRRNPISRKYGFSKNSLARGCDAVGIRYEHLPELGIASEKRQSLDTQADYDALFREYVRDWLPKQTSALKKLRDWFRAGDRVALTCYEHLPAQCHRHCVAEALERQFGKDLHATDL